VLLSECERMEDGEISISYQSTIISIIEDKRQKCKDVTNTDDNIL
jgi:hypothetical protein